LNLLKLNKSTLTLKRGFTLIEILLVVAILSVLLVVVFAALNPAQRLAETRNARRWNDVNQILTAVHECLVDEDGLLASCDLVDDDTVKEIVNTGITTGCNAVAGCGVAATGDCADLETRLVNATSPDSPYLGSLPTDPGGVTTDHTEYTVHVNNGIVTIAACSDELSEVIQVSR